MKKLYAELLARLGVNTSTLKDASNALANGNYTDALEICRLLALNNNAEAQLYIGVIYDNGLDVEQDYTEALKWYMLAAKQGNAEAQFNIGVIYDNGSGVK